MRAVFMGTPRFAAAILAELAQQHEVVAAYTQPDKVRGRGRKPVGTPVRQVAESLGIPVFTPATLKDPSVQSQLASLSPDVACVAAYGAILPAPVLEAPRLGCVNVHASLLPRWRGAAPIERAVLAGDEYAGVCIMRMEEGLDTGDWCVRRKIPISGMSAPEIEDELAGLGASALLCALQQMASGSASWTPQDDSLATYADKVAKGELDLDPGACAEENLRRVLASSPAHPSKAKIAGREATVEQARAAEGADLGPGAVSTGRKRLVLGCRDGALEVLRLKPSGKASMDAKAFLAGLRADGEALAWSRP